MKKVTSRYPGVRYVEHASRMHNRALDRYYSIRYRVGGRLREEGLGWASAGWNEVKAAGELARLKQAHTTGRGPQTLAEAQAIRAAEMQAAERDATTLGAVAERYLAEGRLRKKPSAQGDEGRWRNYLEPLLGDVRLADITLTHAEQLMERCLKAGLAPGSVVRTVCQLRTMLNYAARIGLHTGANPVTGLAFPRFDDARLRFLSRDEAARLLDQALQTDPDLHDAALLSLHTGMRLGEICKLTWSDVHFEVGVVHVLDAKGGSGEVYLSTTTAPMLQARKERLGADSPVFPARRRSCGHIPVTNTRMSARFHDLVEQLGFNAGVSDPRKRVYFHTLRHTFASWLALNGESLLTINKLMRHADIKMTMRYAKLISDEKRRAVEALTAPGALPRPRQ